MDDTQERRHTTTIRLTKLDMGFKWEVKMPTLSWKTLTIDTEWEVIKSLWHNIHDEELSRSNPNCLLTSDKSAEISLLNDDSIAKDSSVAYTISYFIDISGCEGTCTISIPDIRNKPIDYDTDPILSIIHEVEHRFYTLIRKLEKWQSKQVVQINI